MSRRSTLRASDADRERVADRLRVAAAEGRLQADELEDRLGIALSARTYGELDGVVADLPVAVARRSRPPVPIGARVPLALILVAVVIAVSIAGALIGGHVHSAHRDGFAAGAPIVWLIVLAVAGRTMLHRRRGHGRGR